MFKSLRQHGNPFTVEVQKHGNGFFTGISEEGKPDSQLGVETFRTAGENAFQIHSNVASGEGHYYFSDQELFLHWKGRTYRFQEALEAVQSGHSGIYKSPMPGKVIAISVKVGQKVTENDPLFIIEAMKMENTVRCAHPGTVKNIRCKEGDIVNPEEILIEVDSA